MKTIAENISGLNNPAVNAIADITNSKSPLGLEPNPTINPSLKLPLPIL